jgi:hypothetical protein
MTRLHLSASQLVRTPAILESRQVHRFFQHRPHPLLTLLCSVALRSAERLEHRVQNDHRRCHGLRADAQLLEVLPRWLRGTARREATREVEVLQKILELQQQVVLHATECMLWVWRGVVDTREQGTTESQTARHAGTPSVWESGLPASSDQRCTSSGKGPPAGGASVWLYRGGQHSCTAQNPGSGINQTAILLLLSMVSCLHLI